MRHGRPHESLPCPLIQACLLLDAGSLGSVRLATQDENEGRSSAHGPLLAEMQSRQWIGTYAGRGNGDYQGELASTLRAITTYLGLFALTAQVAVVRLDGQYGDTVAIAQRDTKQACI
jgi:hypothetical protein